MREVGVVDDSAPRLLREDVETEICGANAEQSLIDPEALAVHRPAKVVHLPVLRACLAHPRHELRLVEHQMGPRLRHPVLEMVAGVRRPDRVEPEVGVPAWSQDPSYLGQGKIDFTAVIDALADIGFDKWAQLECDAPSGSVENDMTTNLKFIRSVIAKRNGK